MNAVEVEEFLAARHFVYRLFQRLFGDEPTAEFLSIIDKEIVVMSFESLDIHASSEKLELFLRLLSQSVLASEKIASDYARIFVEPASLPAPPWESVYVEHGRVIMTKTTLDVRRAYCDYGFISQMYPRVPEDHIALELDFLASLASEAIKTFEHGKEVDCEKALEASSRFIQDHLGLWVDEFSHDVGKKGDSEFYAAACDALSMFIKADVNKLRTKKVLPADFSCA